MKLVITVPDYVKEQADAGKAEELGMPLWLAYEIANGIPLDEIRSLCREHEIASSALDGTPIIAIGKTSDGDAIWEDLFNYIQTIIEADKG